MENKMNNDTWEEFVYFPTLVYKLKKPEFLESVSEVSEEFLTKNKLNKTNNDFCLMSENYYNDTRISNFSSYVLNTAWNILNNQGYNMVNLATYFSEMWSQEHYKNSVMEQHVHGNGSQIVAFYFLETPKDCSKLVIHDPRPGKVQINLEEHNPSLATAASQMINFQPEAGDLFLLNSYVAHSFTRHLSKSKPIKFVHMNIVVQRRLEPLFNQNEQTFCNNEGPEII